MASLASEARRRKVSIYCPVPVESLQKIATQEGISVLSDFCLKYRRASMTNTQFCIAVVLPFVTIVITWVGTTMANRHSISDLRSEMTHSLDTLRQDMNRRFDSLESKLDRLDTEVRKDHEMRITKLEERILLRPMR